MTPQEALNELPINADEIASQFEELGIVGCRFDCETCPIAVYIKLKTGCFSFIGPNYYSSTYNGGVVVGLLPTSVKMFLHNFDSGKYPKIITLYVEGHV